MEPVLTSALITGAANLIGNGINAGISMYAQDRYMQKWGSPEAQMAHMTAAGINPFTAAGNISGAAGDSPVGLGLSTPNYGDMLANLSNSHQNPTVQENTQSATDKNEAETRGIESDNRVKESTERSRVREAAANAGLSETQLKIAEQDLESHPEILDLTKQEMRAKIDESKALKNKYDADVKAVDEQIKLWQAQIKEIKANMNYLRSAAELNDARKQIADIEKQVMDLTRQRNELELSRYTSYGDIEPYAQKYMEILDNEGEEAAEKYLNDLGEAAEKVNFAMSKGQSSGSTPIMLSNWEKYRDIATANDFKSQCESVAAELSDQLMAVVKAPIKNGADIKEAFAAYDDALSEIKIATALVEEAEKAFKSHMEFQGYRDPNKFYADHWLQVGKIVVEAGTRIAGATALGKNMPNGK